MVVLSQSPSSLRVSVSKTDSSKSKAEHAAALTPDQRDELFDGFTDLELEALETDWAFWGRPKQQAPEDDWTFWFIKSGRGFGKTRTAAEWVRSEIDNCSSAGYSWARRPAMFATS